MLGFKEEFWVVFGERVLLLFEAEFRVSLFRVFNMGWKELFLVCKGVMAGAREDKL